MTEIGPDGSTRFAQKQNEVLHRTLGRFDIVFIVVSAVVGLEMLGSVSSQGPETFTWLVFLIIVFLVPYALIFAETGSAFVGEGGVYLWVRRAFGRPAAAVASAFTWITQPVWVGGSMAFLCAEAARGHLVHFAEGSLADYAFKTAFIWITVLAAILSLRRAKWIPTMGAVCKIVFLGIFILTAAIYAFERGVQDLAIGDFSPSVTGFITLTPLLLFAFLGFESGSSASGEMKNAEKDVAFSVLRSSAMAGVLYLIPVFTILLVIPHSDIDGVSGLLTAVATVFSVYGPAAPVVLTAAVVLFLLANIGQGAAWMIMSDRMQAIAAADGSFFGGFFGKFHKSLGTPIRVNLLSGTVSTVFMIAAMQLTGSSAALFDVVLSVAITTYLFSYLLVIPAAVRLRLRHPEVPRPFRVPGPNAVFVALGAVTTAFVALGSWVSVFPGTLESLLGVPYDFSSAMGVPYAAFEALTLGTIVFIVAIALIGFVAGRRLRRETVAAERAEAEAGLRG
ncbi:amino acid permease [Brachybacterium endophyticum]|uniref:Amino acid permease n=1 Tax=Brachybacterium endophyticum TaxID=2182385 RepID=A0A2U2RJM1_9MICO|nr:APC family permease [Brachybacterium endophyticum]PWH06068.1 amino acid permease [Brachybacterium endophyticum]